MAVAGVTATLVGGGLWSEVDDDDEPQPVRIRNPKTTNVARAFWLVDEAVFEVSIIIADVFEFLDTGCCLLLGIIVSSLEMTGQHGLNFSGPFKSRDDWMRLG